RRSLSSVTPTSILSDSSGLGGASCLKDQPTMNKPVVMYARWSPRPNGAECESILTQFERMTDYCRALDLNIIAEYQDENASGKTTAGRPGLADAIRCVCRSKGVLMVYSLS